MSADEIHRAINLALTCLFLFAWSWSLVTHRHTFSRRQIVISAALIPFFVVIGRGTWSAWQDDLPITSNTWSLTVALLLILGAMAAPTRWYREH